MYLCVGSSTGIIFPFKVGPGTGGNTFEPMIEISGHVSPVVCLGSSYSCNRCTMRKTQTSQRKQLRFPDYFLLTKNCAKGEEAIARGYFDFHSCQFGWNWKSPSLGGWSCGPLSNQAHHLLWHPLCLLRFAAESGLPLLIVLLSALTWSWLHSGLIHTWIIIGELSGAIEIHSVVSYYSALIHFIPAMLFYMENNSTAGELLECACLDHRWKGCLLAIPFSLHDRTRYTSWKELGCIRLSRLHDHSLEYFPPFTSRGMHALAVIYKQIAAEPESPFELWAHWMCLQIKPVLSTCWNNRIVTGVAFCGASLDELAVVAYDCEEIIVHSLDTWDLLEFLQ